MKPANHSMIYKQSVNGKSQVIAWVEFNCAAPIRGAVISYI